MSAFPPHPPAPSVPPPALGVGLAAAQKPAPESLVPVWEAMLLSRRFETRVIELYRQGQVTGGVYIGHGNEATSVGTAWQMAAHDVLIPTHRDVGSHFVRGHTPEDVMLQYMKRKTSQTGGKDSGLHIGREHSNIVGTISPLAHMLAVANGVALAERLKGTHACVLTTVGEGASSLGDFHEALNFAAIQRLPVVFVIVNNQYAYSTPSTIQYATPRLSTRAAGYGMEGETVDGTDTLAVLDAAQRAFERARAQRGPTLIESVTMRMRGHSEHDDFKYVPPALMEAWKHWDPVKRLQDHLAAAGVIDDRAIKTAVERIDARLDAAVEAALAAPPPDGPEAVEDVFRTWKPEWTVPDGTTVLGGPGDGASGAGEASR